MLDRFCPSLKTRVLLDEIMFDMNRYDKNNERYVYLCIERILD
jgi:hypothetical protein